MAIKLAMYTLPGMLLGAGWLIGGDVEDKERVVTMGKRELMQYLQCARNSFYVANFAIALVYHLSPTIRDGVP